MAAESAGSKAAPPSSTQLEEDDPIPTGDDDVDAAYEVDEADDLADAKPRKRRKIVKNSDKKYQCPHGDCGKAYSRAEHLYRHQLNRTSWTRSRSDESGHH